MSTNSNSAKVTPWKDWTEWTAVHDDLSSHEMSRLRRAVNVMNAWSSRARVPISVEATLNIVSVLMEDPGWDPVRRVEPPALQVSLLRLGYGHAISRFVNVLLDLAQKGSVASSMDTLAANIDLPSWIVQIRHSTSHGSTSPCLSVLRVTARKLLYEFIIPRYWKNQRLVIEQTQTEKLTLSSTNTLLSRDVISADANVRCVATVSSPRIEDLLSRITDDIDTAVVHSLFARIEGRRHTADTGPSYFHQFLTMFTDLTSDETRIRLVRSLLECGDRDLTAALADESSLSTEVRASIIQCFSEFHADSSGRVASISRSSVATAIPDGNRTLRHEVSATAGRPFILRDAGCVPYLF